MSEQLYRCYHCLDIGIVVRERFRGDGKFLGMFGSPCLFCAEGDTQRHEWGENGLKRAAEQNEIAIRRLDSLLKSEDPAAEAERWRSASRDRQSRREENTGFSTLGAGIKQGNVGNPSGKRTSVES